MKHKVYLEVKTYATSIFVQLEGNKTGLAYSGDDLWRATKVIDVNDGVLDVVFQCNGVNGTDWEIALSLNDDEKPIFQKKGTIAKKNYSLINKAIPLPKDYASHCTSWGFLFLLKDLLSPEDLFLIFPIMSTSSIFQ